MGEWSAWNQTSQTLPSYVPIIPAFRDTEHEREKISNPPPLATLIIIYYRYFWYPLPYWARNSGSDRLAGLSVVRSFQPLFFVESGEGRLIRWLVRGVGEWMHAWYLSAVNGYARIDHVFSMCV